MKKLAVIFVLVTAVLMVFAMPVINGDPDELAADVRAMASNALSEETTVAGVPVGIPQQAKNPWSIDASSPDAPRDFASLPPEPQPSFQQNTRPEAQPEPRQNARIAPPTNPQYPRSDRPVNPQSQTSSQSDFSGIDAELAEMLGPEQVFPD